MNNSYYTLLCLPDPVRSSADLEAITSKLGYALNALGLNAMICIDGGRLGMHTAIAGLDDDLPAMLDATGAAALAYASRDKFNPFELE